MAHNQVPFLQLIKHLQLFDLLPLFNFDTIVINSGHVQTLSFFPSTSLESGDLIF